MLLIVPVLQACTHTQYPDPRFIRNLWLDLGYCPQFPPYSKFYFSGVNSRQTPGKRRSLGVEYNMQVPSTVPVKRFHQNYKTVGFGQRPRPLPVEPQ
jgi:hypothetical protein